MTDPTNTKELDEKILKLGSLFRHKEDQGIYEVYALGRNVHLVNAQGLTGYCAFENLLEVFEKVCDGKDISEGGVADRPAVPNPSECCAEAAVRYEAGQRADGQRHPESSEVFSA